MRDWLDPLDPISNQRPLMMIITATAARENLNARFEPRPKSRNELDHVACAVGARSDEAGPGSSPATCVKALANPICRRLLSEAAKRRSNDCSAGPVSSPRAYSS